MATRKQEVAIKKYGEFCIVWIDATLAQLRNIEGVDGVSATRTVGKYHIYLDPCYDPQDVLAEIRTLGGDDDV